MQQSKWGNIFLYNHQKRLIYQLLQVLYFGRVLFFHWDLFGRLWRLHKLCLIRKLYKNYLLYQLTGGAPQIILIVFLVNIVGKWNESLFVSFYFIGAVVIFYLAYKNLTLTQAKKKFDFNWKAMLALGWSNPKAWLTMPVGALSATYTDSLIINMLGFYFIALPLFLFGLFFWGTIGKQGSKIAPKKFGFFTAFLLIGFGIYLIYKGIISIT